MNRPNPNGIFSTLSDQEQTQVQTALQILDKNVVPPATSSHEPQRVPTQDNHVAPQRVEPTQQPEQPPRVEASTVDTGAIPVPNPAVITQEEPDVPANINVVPEQPPLPAENPPTAPDPDTYNFNKIIGHKWAQEKCGSRYLVQVEWTEHPPSYVPLNTFTEHGNNPDAWEAVEQYAQENNLTSTTGFKQFRANSVQHKKPTKIPRGPRCARLQEAKKKLNPAAREFFKHCFLAQEKANKAINPDTGKLAEYSTLIKSSDGDHWEESNCEEIGRLAQGYPPAVPKGTDTIHFIRFDQIPKGRKATYLRLVVADRPMKANPRRVRFTVGGDKVDYPYEVSTKTADLATAKILINSTTSTPGARFMCCDIKDFYLNTDMARYEYMRIPVHQIPKKIMDLYNLEPLVHKGAVYVEIRKTCYGLPQSGRLSNEKLVPVLEKAGYLQSSHTPGLFKHETRPVAFSLVVDDFGVKYVGKEHADHLLDTLRAAGYQITVDWEGTDFCGLKLKWDYEKGTVDISMPGYVKKALQRFDHDSPTKPQDAPHPWTKPNYGAKQQMTEIDTSPSLDHSGIKRLQEVIGTLLYYGRAIDNTMLVALGTLASQQTKATEATGEALTQLLDYAATHPEAIVRYTASGMILHIHSDASYLSESEARSRAGGFFYMSNHYDPNDTDAPPPKINGAIHIVSTILSNVMASATEAEVGALFHNAQDACQLRNTLEYLGHPQPATPIQTDNSCAEGIANDTVKQKRSKAIDMRFYWIRDRVKQGQFQVFWRKGSEQLGDYYTKHFPASHHREMRPIYLHEPEKACALVRLN